MEAALKNKKSQPIKKTKKASLLKKTKKSRHTFFLFIEIRNKFDSSDEDV
tara:strand:+ start:82 stop:231 length:150 start_codon:yes stop_codon:yes gene_type:complete